jgi:chromosome segregation ATPase
MDGDTYRRLSELQKELLGIRQEVASLQTTTERITARMVELSHAAEELKRENERLGRNLAASELANGRLAGELADLRSDKAAP